MARPKLVVFTKKDFDGDAFVMTSDFSDLEGTGFNNTISSLIVIEGNWLLFEDANFEGRQAFVTADEGPDSDGAYPKPDPWRNERVSSIRLIAASQSGTSEGRCTTST